MTGKPMIWVVAAFASLVIAGAAWSAGEVVVKGRVIDKPTGMAATGGTMQVLQAGQPTQQAVKVPIEKDGSFTVRTAPGAFSISLINCKISSSSAYNAYCTDSDVKVPAQEFRMEEGEEKSDVVFKIDFEAMQCEVLFKGRRLSLPTDFQIKPGTYRLTWDPNTPSSDPEAYRHYSSKQARERMTKLPELKSDKPTYGCIQIDGTANLLCYIFDRDAGANRDTLYVDANRNGDLTDDKPVTWPSVSSSSFGDTPWVTVQAHQGTGDTRTSHPMKIRWRMRGLLPQNLDRKGAWAGMLDTSNGWAKVIVPDLNNNGLYNDGFDSATHYQPGLPTSDSILFKGGTDRFDSIRYALLFVQGEVQLIAGKPYILTASATGSEITVKAYTGPMGKLLVRKIDLGGSVGWSGSITTIGRNGEIHHDAVAGKEIMLAPGDYTIDYINLILGSGQNRQDVQGFMHRPIHIEPNGQTVLDIIEKLQQVKIMNDYRTVLFKADAEEGIIWSYCFGDVIKGYAGTMSSVGSIEATFDGSLKSIPVYPKPGAG